MHGIDTLFSLKGRVAVVTGGAGNLGSQYMQTLAEAGAQVVSFDIQKQTRQNTQALADFGCRVLSLVVDITDSKAVQTAFKEVMDAFGGAPTILVNNAGLSAHPNAPKEENGPFEAYPEAVWDAMIDSHLKGAFLISQSFIGAYRQAHKTRGSIINISSTYGVVAPEQALYEFRRKKGERYFKPVGYSVAKAGMLGFSRYLAEYCGYEKLGIRVNTLLPGGVASGQDAAFVREYERRTILGRMAKSSDYNGALLFLASDASAYMTGATLVVDGGWTAR